MQHDTFLDLARKWKFEGCPKITLTLLPHVRTSLHVETFITTVERLLEGDIREAEGYMAATLESAEVEGVVRYTMSGGGNGRERG